MFHLFHLVHISSWWCCLVSGFFGGLCCLWCCCGCWVCFVCFVFCFFTREIFFQSLPFPAVDRPCLVLVRHCRKKKPTRMYQLRQWACNRHFIHGRTTQRYSTDWKAAHGALFHRGRGLLLDYRGKEGASSRFIIESSGLWKQEL